MPGCDEMRASLAVAAYSMRDRRGIDATFPFGAEIKSATEVCAASRVCGPALAEHGHEFFEVAAIPGWQDYDFPELRNRGAAPVSARSP